MLRSGALLAALALMFTGCGSHRLADNDYRLICEAYRQGAVIHRGPIVALNFTIEHFHLSNADAADAVATARREYCP